MSEVRTYMSFTTPVDPAKIQSIPDMDLSYSLAGTLTEWDSERQLSAGLAESWKILSPNIYRFTIRKDAHWSNGTVLTANDVKSSLERSIKAHPQDLRSLIQMLDSIDCPSSREVDFRLKVPANESKLLLKLTEPNYGILKIMSGEQLDLTVTTGPFYLSKSTQDQLTLTHNTQWHRYDPQTPTPDQVSIRKPPQAMESQNVLLSNRWPNLIETSSLISEETLKRYEAEKFEIWKRPLDKFFHLHLGKRNATADGRALIRYLRQKTIPTDFVAGLSGFTLAPQIFPRGYQLYSPEFACPKKAIEKLPARFQQKPIEILISPARVTAALKQNIKRTIQEATGVAPRFISVPLEEVPSAKAKGDFDLYAGTVGMADPDPEGIMSFYLESDAPIIHSTLEIMGHTYLERLDSARKEQNNETRLAKMRAILNDAVCEGEILPLFHLSTIGIGRSELDFRNIPSSDESVTLSKIRFKSKPTSETTP